MFFEPLCKGSRGFTNVLLITVNPATLKSIDDPTLFEDWIFILWGHQEAFDGSTSFEVHLYTMFVTGLFKALTHTLVIGYHHVGLWALVVIASVGAHCSFLLGLRSQLGLVLCPFWKFAVFESLVQVFFLLLQEFRTGTNLLSPVIEGAYHTILRC